MDPQRNAFYRLKQRIHELRLREKQFRLLEGVLWCGVVWVGLFLLLPVVEAFLRLGTTGRLVLVVTGLVVAAGTFLWGVVRPLYHLWFKPGEPDDETLALKIGARFEAIRDRLTDALQVFRKHEDNPEGYSLELADASLLEISRETEPFDFLQVAETHRIRRGARVLALALAVTAVVFLVFLSPLSSAGHRLLHPRVQFAQDEALRFTVRPGDAEVLKGENLTIEVELTGRAVTEAELRLKSETARNFEAFELQPVAQRRFRFELANVREGLEYYVEVGDESSRRFKVTVLEPPFVRTLQAKVVYPKYSRLGSQLLDENVGDVAALKGSRVHLQLTINKTVEQAYLVFDDSSKQALTIAGNQVSGRFSVKKSGSYTIRLVDTKGLQNPSPIEYRITALDDQYPLVQITFPGQDVDLGEDMLVPLTVEAEDDFGFSRARIGYQILQGGVREGELAFLELPLPKQQEEKLLLNHTWDLSKLGILPEDVVTYFAEVFDNDVVSGPKSARSRVFRVRFPSLSEIYEEVAKSHEETFESLEDLFEESRELRDHLKEIVQQMKREPELDWEEKQEVQDALKAQEQMQEELEEIQKKLDEMISRMEQNDLLSLETLEKYRELQQLIEEMMTPELKQALEELQKSLEQLDPEELKEAMEKFAASQEEFLRSVERTLNLLKKLQIEQKLEEATRRAEELLRRQEELNKEVAQSPSPQKRNKYAQEERGIRQDTENLSETLEDLKNQMSEFPRMPQDRIEAAQNQAGEQGLQQQLQQAIQQFQSGDMQGAQQTGERISQNMQELLETLQTAQQELSEDQKREIRQAMSRSSHNLLNLSKQQEGLMQSTQGMDRNSPGMNDAAQKQQDLLSGLSRVANDLMELSQKTFFVTPELGKAVGQAMSGMQQALRDLEARNSSRAARNQGEAMSGLNQAVSELRNAMEQMGNASSAIGFQEMMQRLMGLSGQQEGINQRTEQLGGQKPGKLSMQQQAAMQRLAAEQQAVRKSLEQLIKEMGGRSEILGDLGQVSKEMEEVVKQLEQRNVNRNLIQRQKRILSRLLDAQRSMHNREYSKKRQAKTADEYEPRNPAALPSEVLSQKDRLRNELLKALKEGYTKDYQELIRKYFEAVYQEQKVEPMNE